MSKSTVWSESALDKLGKVKDMDIATEFGMSRATVRRRRAELNIPAHEKTIWTAELESLLGTKPDTEIAKLTGLTIEQVIYRRRMLRIPKFNDKRATNGGHSTAGKAGRPTIADRKVSKTVAMRKWAWDYIDSVGVARGDVVMDLIADKLGIAPMENETT